ncbi:MAG: exodeoxyribonuclease VII large subunit [Rubrivivax sp.]|nr:MAG: exodeoxyribonuclease VII large subunit [Rubrivivax sp.]
MSWLDDQRRSSPPPAAPAGRVWGVQALVQAVGDTLAARYGMVTVRGEISGFTRASSGHGYFTLKDERGQSGLRCAMFRRSLSQVDFDVREGQLVEAMGRLSVYEARGELQLVVEGLQQAGAGALYEQFLRLRARLAAEGLFDEERKRAIPAYPRRVAVVTSLAAAALRDVVTALRRRAPHLDVLIVPCAVQGSEAPPQIVDALATVGWLQRQAEARAEAGFDTVILCRGGGSLEDLWAFNDERVVRAIVACAVPVLCGVGHETDITLADLAADLRAPTPTAAAELVAQARDETLAELAAFERSLQWRVRYALEQQTQRLDRLALQLTAPAQLLQRQAQGLDTLERRLVRALGERVAVSRQALAPWPDRLARAARQPLQWAHHRHESLGHRLAALDPRRVLERGYAWVSTVEGQPITGVSQVGSGQSLQVELADGRLSVEVGRIERNPGA